MDFMQPLDKVGGSVLGAPSPVRDSFDNAAHVISLLIGAQRVYKHTVFPTVCY